MRTLTTLLAATAATALTVAAPAFAQDAYVRVGGGYALASDGEANFVDTLDLDGSGPSDTIVGNTPDTKVLVDNGFTANLTAGKMFGQFGFEAEVRYDELGIDGIGDRQTDGDVVINDAVLGEVTILEQDIPVYELSEDDFSSIFVMANAVAEFDTGYEGLSPYLAAGIGVGFHEVLGDSDTAMAYQVKLGVAKDFGGLQGGVEFAYLSGGEVSPELDDLRQVSSTPDGVRFTSDITDFNIPIQRTTARIFIGKAF